jgi:hypothetical protein
MTVEALRIQPLNLSPSIAIPALGCGLGQLAWSDVLPLIQDAAKVLNERGVDVEIYAPLEAT